MVWPTIPFEMYIYSTTTKIKTQNQMARKQMKLSTARQIKKINKRERKKMPEIQTETSRIAKMLPQNSEAK